MDLVTLLTVQRELCDSLMKRHSGTLNKPQQMEGTALFSPSFTVDYIINLFTVLFQGREKKE